MATSHITEVACMEISVEPPLQSLNYKLREWSITLYYYLEVLATRTRLVKLEVVLTLGSRKDYYKTW